MRYIRDFKKTVWGFGTVEAKSEEDAKELFESGYSDEFENKVEHEWVNEICSEE